MTPALTQLPYTATFFWLPQRRFAGLTAIHVLLLVALFQRYFRDRVEKEFLSSAFDRPGELFLFVSGMLSRDSMTELCARLRRVAREFADLHRDDLGLPLTSRYGTSLLLATRAWEPKIFRDGRREGRPPVPAGRLLDPAHITVRTIPGASRK